MIFGEYIWKGRNILNMLFVCPFMLPNESYSENPRTSGTPLVSLDAHHTCMVYMLANSAVQPFSISELNIWLLSHFSTLVLLNFYFNLY